MNLRQTLSKLFNPYDKESTPEWKDDYELVQYTLWATIDTLLSNADLFYERGLTELNARSIDHIEQINTFLFTGKITYQQALLAMSKWIAILIAKEPKYIYVIRDISIKLHIKERTVRTSNLFINHFTEDFFYDWAKQLLSDNQHYNQRNERKKEADYSNLREQSVSNHIKEKQGRFKCLMSNNQIIVLQEELVLGGFINEDVSQEIFYDLFTYNQSTFSIPIKWHKKTVYLAYLFYELSEGQNLIQGNWQTLIGDRKKAFISKGGTIVSTSSFSSHIKNINDKKNESVSYRKVFDYIMKKIALTK